MSRTKLIVLLLALAALLAPLVWWLRQDEDPPADADLRDYRRVVSVEANGFLILDDDEDDLYWPEDDEDFGPYSDHLDVEKARDVVERNREALLKVDEALRRADFQVPAPKGIDDLVGYLLAWRRLAYTMSCHERLLFVDGQEKDAFEAALDLLRLGHRIQRAQGTVLTYMTGAALMDIATYGLRRLTTHTSLPTRELLPYAAEIARYPSDPEGLCDTLRGAYVVHCDGLDKVAAGEPLEPDDEPDAWSVVLLKTMKLNQTKRLLAEHVRELIEAVAQIDRERSYVDGGEKDSEEFSLHGALFGNFTGRTMLSALLLSLEEALHEKDRTDFRVRSTQVLVALRCFHNHHGKLPESLDELLPTYLAEIPTDPFDGEPIRYNLAERRIETPGSHRQFENDGEDALVVPIEF